MLRKVVNARIQHAAHPFQHFDTGVPEVLARILRPHMIEERLHLRRRKVAKETAARMLVSR
jgi:hypothetical protein